MTHEFYTLILVPHAKARFRKFQVSVRLLKWSGITAACLALAFVTMAVLYTRASFQVRRLHELEDLNETLSAKTQEYEQNAARLEARLKTLQGMVNKLGVMAGLDRLPPDPAIAGVGGVSSLEMEAPSSESQVSLKTMESDVAQLTERSARLEAFYKDRSLLLASTPSIWPARGYLSANFGNRNDPFTGQRDFHAGIDISTPRGTLVHAPADGVVVSTSVRGGYGNAIVLDHGFGIVSRYGHLDRFNVKPGQKVRRGDVIGFVGSTGKSTAPHLHYEVWVNDQAQNPIQYILDEYRSFG
jgi:murein DD-endopeptidase MepM/ murein hydrolase activator NlpD